MEVRLVTRKNSDPSDESQWKTCKRYNTFGISNRSWSGSMWFITEFSEAEKQLLQFLSNDNVDISSESILYKKEAILSKSMEGLWAHSVNGLDSKQLGLLIDDAVRSFIRISLQCKYVTEWAYS